MQAIAIQTKVSRILLTCFTIVLFPDSPAPRRSSLTICASLEKSLRSSEKKNWIDEKW